MGEIADDIIMGRCCATCGCYFDDEEGGIYEHGYPVECADCFDEDESMYDEAHQPTL